MVIKENGFLSAATPPVRNDILTVRLVCLSGFNVKSVTIINENNFRQILSPLTGEMKVRGKE